jgi:hypothetical protein
MEEYKWLSMDGDGADQLSQEKPSWDVDAWYFDGPGVETDYPPTFIKPGQLWAGVTRANYNDGETWAGEVVWRGYWWRLVEDHSKENEMKHEYKKGDLVRHKPSGCVGLYNGQFEGESVIVQIPFNTAGKTTNMFWHPGDCEPVTDKQSVDGGLYEACQYALSFEQRYDGDGTCIVCSGLDGHSDDCFLGRIEQALTNSTPVKQEVPADLYEAAERLLNAPRYPPGTTDETEEYRGAVYELRDALANSRPVEQQGDYMEGLEEGIKIGKGEQQGWITDRRPTEDDAYRGEVFAICKDGDEYADQLGFQPVGYGEIELGEPWQPVPICLRTPPKEEPRCETCAEYEPNAYHSLDGCDLIKCVNPTYGMDGCVYKAKED